jgi:hypothetical protein
MQHFVDEGLASGTGTRTKEELFAAAKASLMKSEGD